MRPIYCCFYTRDTLYEREAARLRLSLEQFGLPHDLRAVDSEGDWVANSRRTARHVLNLMDDYPHRPIVQLDADAFVWQVPQLFEAGIGCDVAAHVRRGIEMLNGTLYLAPTPRARAVVELYAKGVRDNPSDTNEQRWLHVAVRELGEKVRFYDLPASYCWIHDVMKDDLDGDDPVIEHLQASREGRHCGALPARRARLAQIESLIA